MTHIESLLQPLILIQKERPLDEVVVSVGVGELQECHVLVPKSSDQIREVDCLVEEVVMELVLVVHVVVIRHQPVPLITKE